MTEETIKMILDFRDRRNWKQFHNPKDLALFHFSGSRRAFGDLSMERF